MEENIIQEEVSLFDKEGKIVEEAVKPQPKEEVKTDPDEGTKPEFEVPEKFKDKSFEDVVQSYMHLEKMHGNTANEVGELRKLTDQILMNQSQMSSNKKEDDYEEDLEFGFDDFVEDPAQAINTALQNHPTLKKLEQTIEKTETDASRKALLDAHPDADEVVASQEFQKWVTSTPGYLEMLTQAHVRRDANVASGLIDLYKKTRQVTNEEANAERSAKASKDLKDAAVETGGAPVKREKIYKRSELIELKLRDPAAYEAMKSEIYAAYSEGRVK